jgi:outer membrane protein OmpA-like peptidoglycan-associated protein
VSLREQTARSSGDTLLTMSLRLRLSLTSLTALLAVLLCSAVAAAQTPASTPTTSTDTTRPAVPTFFGDTGLWYVPTAEVLPSGKWSAGLFRRGTDYLQGHTNVADFATTFAVGLGRAEVFGSFLIDTRIDRDAQPIFFNDAAEGGIIDRNTTVNRPWTGNNIGDFYAGVKVNLVSQSQGNGVAAAVRGTVKIPTGKSDAGVSTGKADGMLDFIVSREVATSVELSGFAGYEFRGSPDGFQIPTRAVNWGVGAAFPSRSDFRLFTELNGARPNIDTATITTASLVGFDLTVPPSVSTTRPQTRATIGATYQAPKGFFLGVGLSLSLPRASTAAMTGQSSSNWDWQVRLGFHPGVRKHITPVPPPPPPPVEAPAPPPPAPANRPPVVKASCDPCTVEIGKTSTVTADAQDPDGDVLTYQWRATAGTLTSATTRVSPWTAPMTVGSVPFTVTVSDGKGGTASDTVTIEVTKPPVKVYAFDDVYFDFDRFALRPEALRVLDEAVVAMLADSTLSLTIEGHTCDIGTNEYNLALGERRARAVSNYFSSRGVDASRFKTVSYGEENPKYDNMREETRRLNRRAALVVTLRNN